jgi:hypothetical protein
MTSIAAPSLTPRALADCLLAGVPMVALVEDDLLRGRAAVARVLANLVALGVDPRPALEWTAASGWMGPESILSQSGIEGGGFKRPVAYDQIAQMREWLETACVAGRVDREFPMLHGVIVLHDLDASLGEAPLIRLLLDLRAAVEALHGTVVVVVRHALAPGHALRSGLIDATVEHTPAQRYGDLVDQTIAALWPDGARADQRGAVVDHLAGLTLAEADGLLRLAAVAIRAAGDPADDSRSLVDVLLHVRHRSIFV